MHFYEGERQQSQARGTSQDRNTIHLTIKRAAMAFKMPNLQSQQNCSSKENFKNEHLTHSPHKSVIWGKQWK